MDLKNNADFVFTANQTDQRKFKWTVENYESIRQSDELLQSQKVIFEIGEAINFQTKWAVYLRLSKDNEDNHWTGMDLRLLEAPSGVNSVMACLELKILKKGDKVVKKFYNDKSPFLIYCKEPADTYGWYTITRKDAVLEDLPLVNGNLVLEVQVKISVPNMAINPKLTDTRLVEGMYKEMFGDKLRSDLAKMLTPMITTDDPTSSEGSIDGPAKIISKDQVQFPVNRGILCARSPVFERMFQSGMEEARTGIVNIKDLSSKTLEVLLHYIYTGTLKENWSNDEVIAELVNAAGKYQFQELLEFLNLVLGNVCSKQNVGKLFNLAKKLELKNAEEMLFDFMKTNIFKFEDMVQFVNDSAEESL